MKTRIKIIALFLVIFSATVIKSEKASAQGYVSFQVFYDELSPYGTWVDNPDYGYVWVPNVDAGFSPYNTNGYWVFTDAGWTWVSNYPWGWAPFHYGRWYTDAIYGPMWVPDNQWGPGWVTWRRSAGYYGWAPIGPGISISVAYGNDYYVPHYQWTFVHDRDFGRTNINNYYVNNSNNVTIINNSTVVNNTVIDKSHNTAYNVGPKRNDVEKNVGKPIKQMAIKENAKPGQVVGKDQIQIYRPQIQQSGAPGTRPVPVKVTPLKEVKTAAERGNEAKPIKSNQPIKQNLAQPKQTTPSKKMDGVKPAQQQAKPNPNIGLKPQQNNAQPIKQQQQQNNVQPLKQQPKQQPKQQQPQKQNMVQPNKQQPQQQQAPQKQNNVQPIKQQQQQAPQQQNNMQPIKQQPQQQQAPQKQNNIQPAKQQSQPQQNRREENPQQQAKPQQNSGGEKRPR